MAEQRNDESTVLDACPDWCARRHTSHDHPEDRLHQSPPQHAVLVTGHRWLQHGPAHEDGQGRAGPVVARLVQWPGSATTWLEVTSEEGGEVRLTMTLESGRRLVVAIESLLTLLRA